MTFLKFAAIYVSPVSLFLFYKPSSCFLFPVAATLLPHLPRPRSRQSLSFSLLFHLLLSPLGASTSRFPRSFYFAPSLPPQRVHRLASTSRKGGKRPSSLSLSLSVPRRIVLLFAIGLRAFFERACEQDDSESMSFSKLKTGLSTSTSGPPVDSTGKLERRSHSQFLQFLR